MNLEIMLSAMCRISTCKMFVYWFCYLKLLAKNLRDGMKNWKFHAEKQAALHYLKK